MSLKFGRSRYFACVVGLVVSSALGCSKSEPPPAPPAPTLFLDSRPGGVRPRETVFDGKIQAVGYKLQSRGSMRPGSRAHARQLLLRALQHQCRRTEPLLPDQAGSGQYDYFPAAGIEWNEYLRRGRLP